MKQFPQRHNARRHRCLFALLMFCIAIPACARTSKYRIEVPAPPARLINGFGVGVDGVGFGMKVTGARFANMEIFGRLNILEKYFPVVELGIGDCNREGLEQSTVFHSRAPYYRVGADYCLTKKRNGNRLLLGLRYAFSSFSFSYENPEFEDPVWGNPASPTGVSISGLDGKMHWLEFAVGIETKIWKFIRMGWSLRYKARLSQSDNPYGDPWYVPGFGKNDGTTFGGTVHVAFEIQPRAKKSNPVQQILEQIQQ